jgi:hypothetical protein
MVPLEDHIQEVVVLDVVDPARVYTYVHLSWNKNEHRNSRASYVRKGEDEAGCTVPIIESFNFCRWEGVIEGLHRPNFFFHFCLTTIPTMLRPWQVLLVKEFCWILDVICMIPRVYVLSPIVDSHRRPRTSMEQETRPSFWKPRVRSDCMRSEMILVDNTERKTYSSLSHFSQFQFRILCFNSLCFCVSVALMNPI